MGGIHQHISQVNAAEMATALLPVMYLMMARRMQNIYYRHAQFLLTIYSRVSGNWEGEGQTALKAAGLPYCVSANTLRVVPEMLTMMW